jgi:hypothetical protein
MLQVLDRTDWEAQPRVTRVVGRLTLTLPNFGGVYDQVPDVLDHDIFHNFYKTEAEGMNWYVCMCPFLGQRDPELLHYLTYP